jgi:hypothetical protein
MKMKKFYSHRTLVSTFAGRTMPTHDQNLQKSFQVPSHGEREMRSIHEHQINKNDVSKLKKMPHAQVEKMKEYE